MNDKLHKFDWNSLLDGKVLFMGVLIAISSYFWNENMKSRERFEQLIISNDKRLTERSMWMRVTDIRLSIIERQLGIEPLEVAGLDLD